MAMVVGTATTDRIFSARSDEGEIGFGETASGEPERPRLGWIDRTRRWC
jgi:hypothetical protein